MLRKGKFFHNLNLQAYSERKLKHFFIVLLVFSFLVRLISALITNLGIDEAYYILYALYPSLSYFDHPPMVGLLIRLSTFNLIFLNDFFVRLGPLVLGVLNLFIIYRTGRLLGDRLTGVIASILLVASFFNSVVSGTFIMPDSSQGVFWLASLYFFLKYRLSGKEYFLILFGLVVGLAMLSKYHAVFLWFGLCLFAIFNDRNIFRTRGFYLAALVSMLVFSPVIIWNVNNDFASFVFHGNRVGGDGIHITGKYIFPEIFGEIFYNNPLNIVIIAGAILYFFKNRSGIQGRNLTFLLWSSFPLIITVLFIALVKRTFAHWSGPAYYGLILFAAVIISKRMRLESQYNPFKLIAASFLFFIILMLAGLSGIRLGIFSATRDVAQEVLGKNDFTLDLYGWHNVAEEFDQIVEKDVACGLMDKDSKVITLGWMQAGRIDWYMAFPQQLSTIVLGSHESIHHYKTINKKRGGVKQGEDAYYITVSTHFREIPEQLKNLFYIAQEPEIITVYRNSKKAYNVFVYRLINSKEDFFNIDIQ